MALVHNKTNKPQKCGKNIFCALMHYHYCLFLFVNQGCSWERQCCIVLSQAVIRCSLFPDWRCSFESIWTNWQYSEELEDAALLCFLPAQLFLLLMLQLIGLFFLPPDLKGFGFTKLFLSDSF